MDKVDAKIKIASDLIHTNSIGRLLSTSGRIEVKGLVINAKRVINLSELDVGRSVLVSFIDKKLENAVIVGVIK